MFQQISWFHEPQVTTIEATQNLPALPTSALQPVAGPVAKGDLDLPWPQKLPTERWFCSFWDPIEAIRSSYSGSFRPIFQQPKRDVQRRGICVTCLRRCFNSRLNNEWRINEFHAIHVFESQEDRFHKKWSDAARSWERPGGSKWKGVFFSWKKTGPCDLGDSNGPLRVVKSPKTSEKIVIFGILRFEKSCSWRSLFNSGPNSKMSPTQSPCLNHGFKDTLAKLIRW